MSIQTFTLDNLWVDAFDHICAGRADAAAAAATSLAHWARLGHVFLADVVG